MSEVYTKESFSILVEETKYRLKLPYLECIIYICNKEKIDEDFVPKLITKQLKRKIEEELRSLKMIRK